MNIDKIFKEFIDHRVSFKDRSKNNGFDWTYPLHHEINEDLENKYNLALVVGVENSHCEFLSWVLNCSSTFQGSLFSYIMEPHTNINFGTFYTYSPIISLLDTKYDFSQKFINEYYMSDNHILSEIKFYDFLKCWKHEIDSDILEGYHSHMVSVPIICSNLREVYDWSKDNELNVYTPKMNLKNSTIRSHYVHMKMKDTGVKEYSLKEICNFLVDIDHTEADEIEDSNIKYVDMNKVFGLDKDYIEEVYNHVGLSRPNWGNLMEKIHDYEFINFPQHELLHKVDSMEWDEIKSIAGNYEDE